MSAHEPNKQNDPHEPLCLKFEHIGQGIWPFRHEHNIYHFEEKTQHDFFKKGFQAAMYMMKNDYIMKDDYMTENE